MGLARPAKIGEFAFEKIGCFRIGFNPNNSQICTAEN